MTEGGTDTPDPGVSRELTAFQQTILYVLAEEARYGLAIKRELESYYGSEVNHGRLYPNLDDLVDLGLVEKGELDKRTNEYGLTAAGVAAVEDQLRWILAKVAAGDDGPDRLQSLLDEVA